MKEINKIGATGAVVSPYDVRTFAVRAKAYAIDSGGVRYGPEDIQDQHRVGVCTAASEGQNAKKATKMEYSMDFLYLCQKKYYDKNWDEGSSAFHALKAAHQIGLLPLSQWKWTTESDRKLSYSEYIKKLQAVPDAEIERLKLIASRYKIKGYSKIATDRDSLAKYINESAAGIIARFVIGTEWWTPPIEPLRQPKSVISGHLVTISNFVGNSFRIANTWGNKWADKGTAYFLLNETKPTEAWAVWYHDQELPEEVQKQLDSRATIYGRILNLIQEILKLLPLLR